MSDIEVMNNDNEIVGRIIVHNVGDGVQVMFFPTGGTSVKSLLFMAGCMVARPTTIGLKRRPGGRVAQVKK